MKTFDELFEEECKLMIDAGGASKFNESVEENIEHAKRLVVMNILFQTIGSPATQHVEIYKARHDKVQGDMKKGG